MIEAYNISKSFGDTRALDGINLHVNKGEIFGFIGANGAGKSTLFDILVTLDFPDTGDVKVLGKDARKEYKWIRRQLGYLPGRFSLYEDLTVRENIRFFANAYHVKADRIKDTCGEIWEQISPFANYQTKHLSGGMKQKLTLCCAMVHEPEILFLDEPTTGIDPLSRHELWETLKRIKNNGITILVSTHYFDEAALCDRLLLLHLGKQLLIDSPENIINSYSKKLYAVSSSRQRDLLLLLNDFEGTYGCYVFGKELHLSVLPDYTKSQIDKFLQSKGITDVLIRPEQANMEDVFMDLILTQKHQR